MGTTDFDALSKGNFNHSTQIVLFTGIFFAFAVKTPTIFLNTWLLRAHVESPLSGSIILAAIVLKLSLYGFFRLVLPILPVASLVFTPFVYMICVITIIYASLSTLRTIDVKELIAYSSVAHAAVYLMGIFSNTITGIEGAIVLGLGHGFVSSSLFICVGGVLYDRVHTRLITYYRGVALIMPVFSLLFFILSLANAGTPITINFVGEFLSLYGAFERLPIIGALACSSVVFSAAYTFFMFNRIAFGGSLSSFFAVNIPDLNKREFVLLFTLVALTILFGIYPSPILDGLHYSVSTLIYAFNEIGDISVAISPCVFSASSSKRFIKNYKPLPSDTGKLSPYFITGFTDGEGFFYIKIYKVNYGRLGLNVHLVFGITLHKKDRAILGLIQAYFNGVGNINQQGKDLIQYNVSSLKDLALIIAHFDKYPLITKKQADYLLFKQVFELISRKEHLTLEGLRKAASIKASSNLGLSEQQKNAFPNIIPVERPKIELSTYINPYWLAGFSSAEGCFSIFHSRASNREFAYRTVLGFRISQHLRDAQLMESLVQHFGCGGYYADYDRNIGQFIVSVFSDITNKIIPFFQEYPIIGVKTLDFADFCKAAELMKKGHHFTESGLNEIKQIKSGMNKGRLL